MSSLMLDKDEMILTTFNPPKRAAYYYFIKNSPIKFIVICILFYYLFSGIFSPNVNTSNTKSSQQASQSQQNTIVQMPTAKEQSRQLSSARSNTWRYSVTYQGTGADLKPFFLVLYLYLQIRRQRAAVGSISYTITNKRILMLQTFPRQKLQSVNYISAKYCSIQQTPIHRLLNLYFICLSSEPLKTSAFTAINQFMYYPSNNVIDLLTSNETKYFMELFDTSKKEIASGNPPKIKTLLNENTINRNNLVNNVNRATSIRSKPSYALFLLPKYFMLYGVWYVLALMCLFGGALYKFGFLSTFYSKFLYSWNSSLNFIIGYTIFFLIIAYLRSSYQVRNYQYLFTKDELIIPRRIDLFTTQKAIPYSDIVNVNIVYSGFNLYRVNFTAKIKKPILGKKNQYTTMLNNLSIPGLSKESADQISLLLSQ